MERSEPTLIPEWLKGSGAVSGGGTASRQMASSSLLSDDHVKPLRNKPLVSTNNHDIGRSFVSDRTTSSDFRRSSSSNGSGHLRSQGKFGSTNRDRDWERAVYDSRDKEKSILGDHRRRQYSDPSENFFPSRFDKDLRRSQSMVTGKRGERWPGEVSSDLSNANNSNPSNLNGLLAGGTSLRSVPKASFERDFPSLGAEEREVVKIGRVSSPGLSTAVRSLPTAMVGGDGWTSALAEVPVLGGNSGSSGSVQQVIPPTSASLPSSVMSGLNMAETLVQCPSRSDTTPQLSAGTQRLEELAIKQSRQLVPMTPSMHKALVPNASEKPKPKLGQQQQVSSLHLGNNSPRSGHAKSDVSRISTVGKLQVLKPARESNGVSPTAKGSTSPTSVGMGKLQVLKPARERNGASPTSKDGLTPTSVSRVTSSPVAVAPSVVGSAPLRSSNNNPNLASAERKPAQATLEKRPTPQAQSRNDFFNLMRKKSMNSPSPAVSGPGLAGSSLVLDKADQTQTGSAHVITQDGDSPLLDSMVENRPTKGKNDLNSAGNSSDWPHESLNIQDLEPLDNGKDNSSSSPILYSEEEEAAFLRSLGWEENGEEDEGLTEEEISSFYKGMDEYIKMRPSAASVFGKMQPNFLLPLSLRAATVGGGATTGSSDSKLES